jgi:hypothetical protein
MMRTFEAREQFERALKCHPDPEEEAEIKELLRTLP